MTDAEIVISFTGLFFIIAIIGCIIRILFYGREDKSVECKAQLDKWSEKSLKDKFVECDKCGMFLRKEKASVVKMNLYPKIEYYCKVCMPKYDEIEYYWKTVYEAERRYYKTERYEVDVNGKRIAIDK